MDNGNTSRFYLTCGDILSVLPLRIPTQGIIPEYFPVFEELFPVEKFIYFRISTEHSSRLECEICQARLRIGRPRPILSEVAKF